MIILQRVSMDGPLERGVEDDSQWPPQAASVVPMSRGKLMKTFGWWPWLPVSGFRLGVEAIGRMLKERALPFVWMPFRPLEFSYALGS